MHPARYNSLAVVGLCIRISPKSLNMGKEEKEAHPMLGIWVKLAIVSFLMSAEGFACIAGTGVVLPSISIN
jgi:hypothetical protein